MFTPVNRVSPVRRMDPHVSMPFLRLGLDCVRWTEVPAVGVGDTSHRSFSRATGPSPGRPPPTTSVESKGRHSQGVAYSVPPDTHNNRGKLSTPLTPNHLQSRNGVPFHFSTLTSTLETLNLMETDPRRGILSPCKNNPPRQTTCVTPTVLFVPRFTN